MAFWPPRLQPESLSYGSLGLDHTLAENFGPPNEEGAGDHVVSRPFARLQSATTHHSSSYAWMALAMLRMTSAV